jgi:LmbE family N-acetylglucosaminyl deacetylase
VNFVAHEDDDVLFLTPDMAAGIRAGYRTITIYVTAGEASHPDSLTPQDYAALRQAAERNAYAVMAGVANVWDTSKLITGTGTAVELNTLRAKPEVQLVFMRVYDLGDLEALWLGLADHIGTELPTGSPAAVPDTYTRPQLLDTMLWLIRRFGPTVIRTMNPAPVSGFGPGNADNPDHTGAALFVDQAAKSYPRAALRYYRGYDAGVLPVNLGPAQRVERDAAFFGYTAVDWHVRDQQDEPFYVSLRRSQIPRWPVGAIWGSGVNAAAVVGRDVLWWKYQDGLWTTTRIADPGPLSPAVTFAGNRLYALNRESFEILTITPGAPWAVLGNPNGPGGGAQTGVPAAAVHADGTAQVFVRNGGGGISSKRERPDRTYGDWQDMQGAGVQDGLSAITAPDGRMHLFVTRCDEYGIDPVCSIGHLAQRVPNGPFVWMPDITAEPATAPTAVVAPDGRLHLYFREAVTGTVQELRQNAAGTWDGSDLGNPGGLGEVAAGIIAGRLVLATRGNNLGVMVRDAGPWSPNGLRTDLPPVIAGGEVVVTGLTGRLERAAVVRP